jgi:hypothetical protein
MLSIRHVGMPLKIPLKSVAFMRSNEAKILFIYTQETLSEDFDTLKKILALPEQLKLPDDEVAGHCTPEGMSKYLSETAQENLRKWYAEDLEIYRYCQELRSKRLAELQ